MKRCVFYGGIMDPCTWVLECHFRMNKRDTVCGDDCFYVLHLMFVSTLRHAQFPREQNIVSFLCKTRPQQLLVMPASALLKNIYSISCSKSLVRIIMQ
jgi:hypothetical protein